MSFSEWKEVKLGDIAQYSTSRIATELLTRNNYISTENMLPQKGGSTIASTLPRGNVVKYRRGQTLISNIRPYFKKIWYATNNGGCSSDVLVFDILNNIYSKYFYYLLSQDNFFDYMMAGSKGTKMPRGDKKQIMMYPILLPPPCEQESIADTLSCIDNKIELNNRINKTLEEMAQAIFKSWFVDFEPFQDGEFEESELGRIPKGWKNGKIFDMGTVLTGKTPPTSKKEFYGNDIPFIKTPDMHGNIYITTVENKLSLRGAEYQNNKYIPKNSVIMSCIGAKAGVVSLTSELSQTNQQINAIISEWPYYVYYTLKMESDNLRNIGSSGSTMININKSTFENYKILIPSQSILRNFNEKVQPIFEMILNNQNQNRNLEILRDSLLPKLMSGEIRVPTEEVQ